VLATRLRDYLAAFESSPNKSRTAWALELDPRRIMAATNKAYH
jgi:hypothetical protein